MMGKMYPVPSVLDRQLVGISRDKQQFYIAMNGHVVEKENCPELFDESDSRFYNHKQCRKNVFTFGETRYTLLGGHFEKYINKKGNHFIVIGEYPGEEQWEQWWLEVCLYGWHM